MRHLHSSSRFDRAPESLEKAARAYNARHDLVTYTEVEFERREKALVYAGGTNWGIVSGDESNKNDSVITYDKGVYKLVYSENFNTGQSWTGGGTLYATIAVLEELKTDKEIVVTVIHLPAGVEGDLYKKRLTARTRAWFAAFRSVKKRTNRLKKRFKAKGVLFVADFNINFKKQWARALVKALAPTYSLTWKDFTGGGTHGNRLIDGTLVKGMKGRAFLFKDDASSDHRPYDEELRWA